MRTQQRSIGLGLIAAAVALAAFSAGCTKTDYSDTGTAPASTTPAAPAGAPASPGTTFTPQAQSGGQLAPAPQVVPSPGAK
jgi:hypothetical protein